MKSDNSTREKIINAGRKIFLTKGFDGTRTRDITQEAGINTALLNYHFGSKENLFEIVMLETMSIFMQKMSRVFNDTTSTFEQKIKDLCENYINFLIEEPALPLFILVESRKNPERLMNTIPLKEIVMHSSFVTQFQEGVAQGKYHKMEITHLIANLMSLIIFPFVAENLLSGMGDLNDEQFKSLLTERKTLIPKWFIETIKP